MGSAVRSTKHGIRLANRAHQFHRVSLDFFFAMRDYQNQNIFYFW